jgi:hypothetical protein
MQLWIPCVSALTLIITYALVFAIKYSPLLQDLDATLDPVLTRSVIQRGREQVGAARQYSCDVHICSLHAAHANVMCVAFIRHCTTLHDAGLAAWRTIRVSLAFANNHALLLINPSFLPPFPVLHSL